MRRLAAECPFTLFAVALVCLVLASGQLVLPARVDCRTIPYGSEDGGDPDMPDQVMAATIETESGRFSDFPIVEDGAFVSSRAGVDSRSHAGRVAVSHHAIQREFLFRLWFSLASIGFAY